MTLAEYIEYRTRELQVRYKGVRLFGVSALSVKVWSTGSTIGFSCIENGEVSSVDLSREVKEFRIVEHTFGSYVGARINHWFRRPRGRKTHHAFVDVIFV